MALRHYLHCPRGTNAPGHSMEGYTHKLQPAKPTPFKLQGTPAEALCDYLVPHNASRLQPHKVIRS